MIKTCQITSVHPRYDSRIFRKIATSLSKNGYDSYVLVIDDKGDEVIDGVKFVSLNHHFNSKFKRIFNSWKLLKTPSIKINADVYHIHDPELLPLCIYLKKKGKRVIFDSHEDGRDIGIKDWIPKPLQKIVCSLYLFYEKKVLKKIDGAISVDQNIVDRFRKINKNSIMISNFPILKSLKKNDDKCYDFAFAGSPHSYAQFEFISALKISNKKDIKYRLATDLDEKHIKICKNLSNWSDIISSGYVNYEEVQNIYSKTKIGMVLAYPDIGTDFNNGCYGVVKFFEFLERGIPIICSNFKIWQNIINKYGCGICVNPYSISDISKSIDYLLNNPAIIEEMGKNGRKAIEQEFNWGIEEKKLFNFYNSLFIIK